VNRQPLLAEGYTDITKYLTSQIDTSQIEITTEPNEMDALYNAQMDMLYKDNEQDKGIDEAGSGGSVMQAFNRVPRDNKLENRMKKSKDQTKNVIGTGLTKVQQARVLTHEGLQ